VFPQLSSSGDPAGGAVLARLLTGDPGDWRALSARKAPQVLADAERHGVHGLLRRRLASVAGDSPLANGIGSALDSLVLRDAIIERQRRSSLAHLVDVLRHRGIPLIVMKGGALAYTHYDAPYLRPRCDTDLLIQRADRPAVDQVLRALGYESANMVSRESVHTQCAYRHGTDQTAVVDVHWAISSRPHFAGLLSFDELTAAAGRIDLNGQSVAVPGPVHALLLACIHRVAHHYNSDRLIWLYDIKLLAERFSGDDWQRVSAAAATKALTAVCRAGLDRARDLMEHDTVRAVRQHAHVQPGERAAAYLSARPTTASRILLDVAHAGSFGDRARIVLGHSVPDVNYMREAYDARTAPSLVWAYLRRAVGAAARAVHEYLS
jgi:hypothetical protein